MKRVILLGSVTLVSVLLGEVGPAFTSIAEAKPTHHSASSTASRNSAHGVATAAAHAKASLASYSTTRHGKYANRKGGKTRYARYGGIQCVPFARAASGIVIKGNAANWWDAAAGVYERGSRPEVGSVLNFRASGGMRLGHVAVVTAVRDGRSIEIEHANWSKGSVARNVSVVDVSPDNDWSQVRVQLGRGGDFGHTYPTYGFIYDRPDSGTMLANDAPAPSATVQHAAYEEVAEMPTKGRLTLRKPLILDAPDRSLR